MLQESKIDKKEEKNIIEDVESSIIQDLYLDDTYYTNLHFFYVNKQNVLERIKEETLLLYEKNIVTIAELQTIIQDHTLNSTYQLSYLLKYNYANDDVNDDDMDNNNNKWETIKSLHDIVFKKTINMFQDLTDLVFVFVKV